MNLALIRHWRLLRQWIEQNRDLLRQERRIEASTVVWQEREQARGYLLQGIPLTEAIQFREQQADALALSDAAKAFIQKSVWQRRRNRLKTASWLIIPAVLIVGLVEYNVRETRVKSDYVSLGSDNKAVQRQAVRNLVAGCWEQRRFSVISDYLTERLFGNCRPLGQVDFRGIDLRDIDLSGVDLHGIDLSDTDLSFANLSFANLSDADLSDSNLRDVDLSLADLRDIDLSGANLSGANLNDIDLIDASLSGANLIDASLSGANLSGANLSDIDLSGANLSGANLGGVNLSGGNLSFADLSGSNLSGSNLSDAGLYNADLSGAGIISADLRGADLRGADLSDANLINADLSGAIFLNTDIRLAQNMNLFQLIGENQPLICNSPLPKATELENVTNRDCDRLPDVLRERYPNWLETLEEAEAYVAEQRKRKWD